MPRNARPIGSGADHFGRRAAAEQQAQGVDDDRLAAAGFAGQQVQPAVKANAEALDDRVVFDGEFGDHVTDYSQWRRAKTFLFPSV